MFRNRVIRSLKKSKIEYYSNYFKAHSNDINKTWKGIRSIVNTKKKKISQLTQLKVGNKTLSNPNEIANEFNNFFSNIGPSTEKNIATNPTIKFNKFLKDRLHNNFVLAHVSDEEILAIIQQLENKCTGPKIIPTNLLKLIPDLILLPLSNIINKSFETGISPDALKICKVVPTHKEGPTIDVNNYRPISLLSIFDKIIEKVMYKRLYEFLQCNNVLYKKQFGFRKNYSTTHTILEITEKIKESIENKQFGCGIFIVIHKAFNTVNTKILLAKLEHYGIRGIALDWFNSYLSNRKQFAEFSGIKSEFKCYFRGLVWVLSYSYSILMISLILQAF